MVWRLPARTAARNTDGDQSNHRLQALNTACGGLGAAYLVGELHGHLDQVRVRPERHEPSVERRPGPALRHHELARGGALQDGDEVAHHRHVVVVVDDGVVLREVEGVDADEVLGPAPAHLVCVCVCACVRVCVWARCVRVWQCV